MTLTGQCNLALFITSICNNGGNSTSPRVIAGVPEANTQICLHRGEKWREEIQIHSNDNEDAKKQVIEKCKTWTGF